MLVFLKISGTISVNLVQWRKKWFNVSISKRKIQIGLSVSKKLQLILCSLKWPKPTQRQVRKNNSFRWLTLNTSLPRGLIHCVKSVQIRSFFWSVFSPNTGKYRPEKNSYLDTFHTVIRFKIFFLKTEYEGELRISEFNLFLSTSSDGKKKN